MKNIKRTRAKFRGIRLAQFGRSVQSGPPKDIGLDQMAACKIGGEKGQGSIHCILINLPQEDSSTNCVDNFSSAVMCHNHRSIRPCAPGRNPPGTFLVNVEEYEGA